ncbi:helix-turn-helix domain-containing protein [Mucilaginibacter glaciei]|uniref:Helix-turn-helix transcriptional regulator n=1 Tax=Mucilaginibacter glaciei TaxID=2772109 RepID=A0A926NHZ8_9SPHI|nr:response regulator transcription factor [Mucilaginibacter glaciei]MBD1391611.1 helix-turn-helix transcriptional regulator [Mucilaginibacter glaciei]
MAATPPFRIKTISEFHQFRGLPKPEHPLVSVINLKDVNEMPAGEVTVIKDFYSIAMKKNFNVKMKYGQQQYDFDEGTMFFMAPGQVLRLEVDRKTQINQSGWMLLFHPDFLWNTALAKTVKNYEYFDYSVNEALFLSDKEETIVDGIMQNIHSEYHANIDQFSQDIIIAQIELLLNYSDRFYHRQFITRKISNHQLLDRLETILKDYFENDSLMEKGIPSVQHIANALNVSPNYLSGSLKTLTGQSTQQHIHNYLIEKAKQKLSTTALSVSEIAYQLGFEHPQSFSKLFKTKTELSPLEFRASFN